MVKQSLAEAHATLGVEQDSTLEVVKSSYKRLAIRHHPDKNGNSPESNAKFVEIGAAYERILKHHESPEPEFGPGRGGGGFPGGGGFFFAGGSFFYSGGGFPGGGFGRPGGEYADDDEYDEADEDYESYSDDEFGGPDPRDYFNFIFEDILGGGYGSRSSYAQRRSHDKETPQEHADRVHAEAERLKESQKRKEMEEKKRREMMAQAKEQETVDAAARRQQKKAAAVASKSAAETQAADLARKRLALLQTKRTAVFEAARRTAFDVVKHGVYEDNVDPNGGEFLPGGREAVEECKEAGINLEEETSNGSKSKNAKKKAKAKLNKAASSSSSPPSTTLSSPEIPTGFPATPTPVKTEQPATPSQTAGLFEGNGTNKKKGGKKQKKKGNNVSNAPVPADATTSTPPPGASPDTPTTTKSQESAQTLSADPRETLLHIVVQHGEKEMVEWLLSHGAVPEERNSSGQTAFHLALILNHTLIVEHLLSEYTPLFPPPNYRTATESPDVFYPLPKNQTLLSLALIGGAKDPVKVLDLVRLVLPFVGGKEVRLGWRKADFEQGRKGLKDWKWDSWESIKWEMASRMQELDFEGFSPPEEYHGRRPRY